MTYREMIEHLTAAAHMTEKEYRSHPAISRSELWVMNQSPEKFKWAREHTKEPTPSLLFGQVVHKLVLQPKSFQEDFAVMPSVDRRTKAGREQYEQFLADAGMRTVISEDMYNQAHEMAAVLYSNPTAVSLLQGIKEVPLFWRDPDTGVECKCRLDLLQSDENGVPVIVDYKTASDASYRAFMRDVVNYGYYFQSAMYSEGVIQNGLCPRIIYGQPKKKWVKDPSTGKRKYYTEIPETIVKGGTEGKIIPPRWFFIVQEKAEPYSVNIFEMDTDFITAGYDKYRELIGTYASCVATDYWPGYMGAFDEPNILTLPAWLTGGDD